MSLAKLRESISKVILPTCSYEISWREQLATLISPKKHYTISLYTDNSKDPELKYLTFDENNKPVHAVFFEGNVPQEGEKVKMDIFIPGGACYVPYGIFEMPIRKVRKKGQLLEAIIHTEEMKANKIS